MTKFLAVRFSLSAINSQFGKIMVYWHSVIASLLVAFIVIDRVKISAFVGFESTVSDPLPRTAIVLLPAAITRHNRPVKLRLSTSFSCFFFVLFFISKPKTQEQKCKECIKCQARQLTAHNSNLTYHYF